MDTIKAVPVSQTLQSDNRWAFPGVFHSLNEGNSPDRIGRSSFNIAIIARGLPIPCALYSEQDHGRESDSQLVATMLWHLCVQYALLWTVYRERIILSADLWMRSCASSWWPPYSSPVLRYSLTSQKDIKSSYCDCSIGSASYF